MKIGQGSIFVGNENGLIPGNGETVGKQNVNASGKSIDGRNLVSAIDPIAQKKARAQRLIKVYNIDGCTCAKTVNLELN